MNEYTIKEGRIVLTKVIGEMVHLVTLSANTKTRKLFTTLCIGYNNGIKNVSDEVSIKHGLRRAN